MEGVEADFLEKVAVMPEVTENAVLCYVGADTAKYKQGHIYKGVFTDAVPSDYTDEPGVQWRSCSPTDANPVYVYAFAPVDFVIETGLRIFVLDTENDVYYEDVAVESDTDNEIYPSTKVDEENYKLVTGNSGTVTLPVKDWREAIDLSEINEILNRVVERVSTIPAATEADVTSKRALLYMGTTTQDYIHGHFYQAVSDGEPTPTYSWEEFDTEADDYDHIENRPLELTRGAELYNDTVTLDAGDTTSITLTDKVLVADKKYIISIDDTEHEYTATLDSSDDSINIDASDIGITISTADSASDSTMVLTNAEFASDPAIIVKEANIVAVNPEYKEFFDGLGKEPTLSTDITFNVKVGGWEVGDIAHAGMTQQAFNERLAHEYKEPTLTFTTTSAKLIKKGTSLAAPTVTATSTKVDLDITKTAIVFGGVDVETSNVSTGATINYTFAEDLTEDTTITATVTDAKKTKSAEIKFEFIDPFYWGESATNVLDQVAIEALTMDLSKKDAKKYTYPTTSAASYLVIAYLRCPDYRQSESEATIP